MTEAEWLAATDPKKMLDLLSSQASDRKLRLFVVAVASQFWDRITEPALRDAIGIAELATDGKLGPEEMATGAKRLEEVTTTWQVASGAGTPSGWYRSADPVTRSLLFWVTMIYYERTMKYLRDTKSVAYGLASEVTAPHQPPLLREVFGNPFRPVDCDPSWRTDTVLSLAKLMYDSRDFSPMPILADALQDAGCEQDDILSHGRVTGPHVRGCWVVDLVLGRE